MEGNIFAFAWEEELILFLQNHLGDFGIGLAKAVTVLGNELVVVAIMAFIYWCINKELGKKIAEGLLLVSAAFPMIKNIALRLRPYMANSEISCLQIPENDGDVMDVVAQGYSFPSGHAAMTGTFWGAMGYYVRKKWMAVIAVILPLLIGVSRFMVGVHYPTDVLCGWGLSMVCLVITGLMRRYIEKDWLRYLILIVIALPGVFYCRSTDYFSALGMIIGFAAGALFEKKYVAFEKPEKVLYGALRLVVGLGLYLALSSLLKLPMNLIFGKEGMAAMGGRVIRYFLCTFVLIGLYPMVFKPVEEWLNRVIRKT